MTQVGDNVTVKIGGGNQGASIQGGGGASIGVGAGASMSVPGKIIENLGDSWKIQLSISVGGKNTIVAPKSSFN